jgi:hypothetical protein
MNTTMEWTVRSAGFAVACWLMTSIPLRAAEPTAAEQTLAAAAQAGKYAYVMFYWTDDAATQAMRKTVAAHVGQAADQTSWVQVRVNDPAEAALVARFDATRIPLPCVMGLAPNGAVTGAYRQTVTPEQLERAILTPKYSEMVKALQDQKIAVLCLQPEGATAVPKGIQEFEADAAFKGRIHQVSARAGDASEARLFERMKVPAEIDSPVVIVFAPPGVFLGKFDAKVTGATLSKTLHDSGKCNCHHCQQQQRR